MSLKGKLHQSRDWFSAMRPIWLTNFKNIYLYIAAQYNDATDMIQW